MLEIEGVSIRFGDNPEAVSDTTFTVGDGDRLAVVGETGSGKSVLLLAALGLLPASARVTGSIRLNGRELLGCQEREVGYLFISHDRALCERFCTAIRPLEGGRLGEPV